MRDLFPVMAVAAVLAPAVFVPVLWAQQTPSSSSPQQGFEPIAETRSNSLDVSGAVDVKKGEMVLGNGSTVTARSQAVNIHLRRGGEVRICPTTSLHLDKDSSIHDSAATALMLALDRGALEAHYKVGKYSDVLLTPDLRILISGPGQADLRIRVNSQGDTCVSNRGVKAPYVLVSSQLEGGAYRVMPNQRVIFEHGSLSEVVDRAAEPCGCPPPAMVDLARAAPPGKVAQPVGGPSSTPQDTAFPLAESQGLAPPPPPPSKPIVPTGQVAAQVTVPLTYNGENPPALPPTRTPAVAEAQAPTVLDSAAPPEAGATQAHKRQRREPVARFFGGLGRFFSRIFRR